MSALNQEFAVRGLVRLGRVAKQLHCTDDAVRRYVKAGQIKAEGIPWGKNVFHGVHADEVQRAHDRMWKNGCPWAAKGLCELP